MPHKLLFIKTETTGLPKTRDECNTENYDKFPRLLAIYYRTGYFDKKQRKVIIEESKNILIKPKFKIPAIATKINGITQDIAKEHGYSIKKVLKKIRELITSAVYIIGHNILFDINTIQSEFIRNKIDFNCLQDKKKIDIIAFNHEYDRPKLLTLYQKLYGEDTKKPHSRKSNVNIVVKCFEKLLIKQL